MSLTVPEAITLRAPDKLFIDGEWVSALDGGHFDVIQPTTEELFLRVAAAGPSDIDRAVSAARRAFDEGPWPRMDPSERAGYLRELARGLRERAEDIAFGHTNEMGVLYAVAQFQRSGGCGHIRRLRRDGR